jgi:hypothetical protein
MLGGWGGGGCEMGQKSESWNVRCAQKMTRWEGAGKGGGSKCCRGAVALRAALESAVQLGRGDEGNRQAEMANRTKCRESLQVVFKFIMRSKLVQSPQEKNGLPRNVCA